MISRQQKEMQKLWKDLKQVEAWPTKNEAEFKSKQKELARLKSAYEKARGCAASERVDRTISKAKTMGAVFGGRQEHETRDSLEEYRRDDKR